MTDKPTAARDAYGHIAPKFAQVTDEVLFGLSYDYVGDLSETVALMWPSPRDAARSPPPCGEGWGVGVHNGSPSLGHPHPSPLPQAGEGARRARSEFSGHQRSSPHNTRSRLYLFGSSSAMPTASTAPSGPGTSTRALRS